MQQIIKDNTKKNKYSKMLVMLLSCTIFFGGIFGYKIFGRIMMNKHFNNMPIPMATITSAEVKQYNWPLIIDAVGTVQAINSVDVTTEAPGAIETIKFNSGDKVAAGDILVELNTKVDNAQLAMFQAAMKLATQNFSRAQQLFKANTISKAELDSKQSAADQAIANVAVQQELVKRKQIHAPFTGQLGIRRVNLGEYINPGHPIVNLQSLDPVYVNFSVPEQELYHLQSGLEVFVKVDALKNEVFNGKITAIEPAADPITRNFNIQATFENKAFKLRSGMFADVTIKLASNEKVIAIPRSAVSYNPYGNSVYMVQPCEKAKDENEQHKDDPPNKDDPPIFIVKRRFIELGHNQGEMVEVINGISPNDVIATSGILKLRNDAKVIINNAITPTTDIN